MSQTKQREFPIGFQTKNIAGRDSTVAWFSPESGFPGEQKLEFTGRRLVVPSTIANHFSILGLRVGGRLQPCIPKEGLPAKNFTEFSSNCDLDISPLKSGEFMELIVNTPSKKAIRFQAAMIGKMSFGSEEKP